jgi:hypothetical protein
MELVRIHEKPVFGGPRPSKCDDDHRPLGIVRQLEDAHLFLCDSFDVDPLHHSCGILALENVSVLTALDAHEARGVAFFRRSALDFKRSQTRKERSRVLFDASHLLNVLGFQRKEVVHDKNLGQTGKGGDEGTIGQQVVVSRLGRDLEHLGWIRHASVRVRKNDVGEHVTRG